VEGRIAGPPPTSNRARRWLQRLLQRLRPKRKPAAPLFWEVGHPYEVGEARQAKDRLTWWAALTHRDPFEVQFLLDLSEQTPAGPSAEIVGVGYSPPIQQSEWRPLLLLDSRIVDTGPLLAPVPAARLGSRSPLLVEGPSDLLVLPVDPVEPMGGVYAGDSVRNRENHEVATVGVRAVRPLGFGTWQRGFLTAGHAFPDGPGSEVYSMPNDWFGRYVAATFNRGKKLGTVALHDSPSPPNPEQRYDYAFVDLEYEEGDWDPSGFLAELPVAPDFSIPREVAFRGGASGGTVKGTLMGALMGMACWRDCWMFGPTCAVRKGDSGSAVALEPGNENLGVLVGQSAVGEQEHHVYVQSLQRLLTERLRAEGVLIEPITNGGRE
jgi:hypothetical protein